MFKENRPNYSSDSAAYASITEKLEYQDLRYLTGLFSEIRYFQGNW